MTSSRSPSTTLREQRRCRAPCFERRQFEVTREVDLHAMAFANRDRRHPIEITVHRLRRRLSGCVADAACDDDGVAATAAERSCAEVLGESGDESDRCG